MNTKQKVAALVAALCCLLTLSGCVRQHVADDKGRMLRYTLEELTNDLYVSNADGTFSPLCSAVQGYAGETVEANPARFIWYGSSTLNIDGLIPVLYPGQSLIIRERAETNLPASFFFEQYEDLGYTIGVRFQAENGKMYLLTSQACADSVWAPSLSSLDGAGSRLEVVEFNDSSDIPVCSVNPSLGILAGLDKDATYTLRFYIGTYFRGLRGPADTRVLQSAKMYELTERVYTETHDGYFVVNVPDDLPSGYYYVNKAGLMYIDRTPQPATATE